MDSTNHQLFDIRLRKPIVYRVKDIGQDVTTQIIETFNIGESKITFFSPNLVSLFLSKSKSECKRARELYNKLIKPKLNKGLLDLSPEETVEIFDYLECIQTSIIMLYSAIESLVNMLIPSDYHLEEVSTKGIKEIWDKSAIERWKQTSEKLTKILPQALNIKSPSSFQCWSSFKELEKVRNDIIHVKYDSVANIESDKKLIIVLLNESIFKKIIAGNELIRDLSIEIPSHYEFPMLLEKEIIVPIEIESWGDVTG